jgi:Fic family protein
MNQKQDGDTLKTADFKSNAPGNLVAIQNKKFAFVPRPLPPNWKFPLELWPLLGEAKQQIGILEGIGRNLPNPTILLRPLSDREAIQSSRLEGTYVTSKELLLFELEPTESKGERTPTNDRLEVLNYRRALNHGVTSELPLSLRLLRELHRILLTGVRGQDRSPGAFRQNQVAIDENERFVPPPPERLTECLVPLEKYFHIEDSAYDPLVNCFLVHYQFESIHPFVDGNGRVGRLLLAIMLQRHCSLSKPWLYLSEYYERKKDEYIDLLYRVSTEGNWHHWIEFCLEGTVVQAKETIERCQRLLAIRERFIERISTAGGSVRLSRIVEDIFDSPFVRVAELSRRLEVTYPTARADIDKLVSVGVLKELPDIRPRTFFAPEVFEIAYESIEND